MVPYECIDHYILSNRFYTGDSEWHKTCATDTLPIRQVKNRGQKPKYYVEDDHPGIVSREKFQRVQEQIAIRKELFYRGSAPSDSAYIGHIFCGHCGCLCRRKVRRGVVHWVCNRRDDSKDLCPIPQIPEAALTAAVLRLHNKLLLHGAELLQPLLEQLREVRERELRSNSRLSDIDKEIAHISGQNLALSRLKSKGCIDSALALSQADGLSRKLRDLRRLRRKLLETAGGDEQIRATEAMLDYLEAARWQDEADPEWFGSLVDRITVASAEEVIFQLPNGLELTERLV